MQDMLGKHAKGCKKLFLKPGEPTKDNVEKHYSELNKHFKEKHSNFFKKQT